MDRRQRQPIVKPKMLNSTVSLPSAADQHKRQLIMVVTVWVTHPTAVHVRRVVQQRSISFTDRGQFLKMDTQQLNMMLVDLL
jgi:hypothetical protein